LWRTFTWKWPSRHSNQTSQSSAQTTLTTTTSNTLRLADFWNVVAGGHYSVSSLCTIRLQQLSYNDLAAVTAALSTSLRSSLQELHIDEWVDIEIATAIAKTPASMTSVTDADSSASLSVASSATTASLMSLSSEGDANSEDQSSSNVASRVDEPVSPKVLSLQLARAIVHDCECLHTFTVAGCFPTFWSSVRQGRMVQAALERNKHERRLLVATLALPLPTSSLSTTSATDQLVANVTTTTSSKPLSSNSASAIIQSLAPTMAVSTAVHATQTGPNSMLKGLLGYSANAR
jgi:hypothetical protein